MATKIGIAGCLGKMGRELVEAVYLNKHAEFAGGFEHLSNLNIGKSIGDILNLKINYILTNDKHKTFQNSDVIIDFTTPESTNENLLAATQYNKPLVIGTTGLSREIEDLIIKSSKKIPIIKSANMSVGVNILFKLIENVSIILKAEEYDAEIYEIHHKHKIDSPSGTALALGHIIANTRNVNFDEKKVFDRVAKKIGKKTGDIDFSVSRAGEIAGEHKVSFIGDNDQLEIVHKAKNRLIFVNGAIQAALWLVNQKPGIYSMKEVLGI